MSKIRPPLTKTIATGVAAATLGALEKEIDSAKELKQIKQVAKLESERAKQLGQALLASEADKIKLIAVFFEDLKKRLALVLDAINHSHKDFGFESINEFEGYVRGKVTSLKATTIEKFVRGREGRKWWFIGTILFERYIKYGPVRRFLDEAPRDARDAMNNAIKNNKAYKMINAWNDSVTITKGFGQLLAGLEFMLETAEGEKQFLDFGHIAFNADGYLILPTPTEIKQLTAAKEVAKQFSEFIGRLRKAKKLIVKFSAADYGELEKYVGSGIVEIKKREGEDGFVFAEIDRRKLVFDQNSLNQMVVKPTRATWGRVEKPVKSPDIDVDLGTTSHGEGFNYWKIEVGINRYPFERLFQAIFLGTK